MPVYSRKRPVRKTYAPRRKRIGGSGGAYTLEDGPWANAGAAVGYAVGSRYGDRGKRIGEWLGRRVGYYGSRVLGGDGAYKLRARPRRRRIGGSGGAYTVDGPIGTYQPTPPRFETVSPEKGILIEHREYLGDIITSATAGAFKIDTFALNPSEINTFPWLSQLATNNFQQYIMEGLKFEFKSFSADALNSTNTALGAVFAAINYDYNDPDFTSRQQIENSDWSSCSKPSESFDVWVECKRSVTGNGGLFYIVNGSGIPTGTDAKQYYMGKLSIASQGMQGTSVNIGSLYVTYKIRLIKPFMTAPLASALIYNGRRSGCTGAILMGTASLTDVTTYCDSIGVTFGNNTITLNKKRLQSGMVFRCTFVWGGGSTAVTVPTLALSSGAQGLAYEGSGAVGAAAPTAGATSTTMIYCVYISVDNPNSDVVFTFSAGTPPSATCYCAVNICQVNGTSFNNIGTYTP